MAQERYLLVFKGLAENSPIKGRWGILGPFPDQVKALASCEDMLRLYGPLRAIFIMVDAENVIRMVRCCEITLPTGIYSAMHGDGLAEPDKQRETDSVVVAINTLLGDKNV